MTNMLVMLYRVAVCAQDFKIRNIIVVSIMISMMNTKYIWMRVKTASVAFLYHASSLHLSSYGSKFWRKCLFIFLADAGSRAIFPAMIRI